MVRPSVALSDLPAEARKKLRKQGLRDTIPRELIVELAAKILVTCSESALKIGGQKRAISQCLRWLK